MEWVKEPSLAFFQIQLPQQVQGPAGEGHLGSGPAVYKQQGIRDMTALYLIGWPLVDPDWRWLIDLGRPHLTFFDWPQLTLIGWPWLIDLGWPHLTFIVWPQLILIGWPWLIDLGWPLLTLVGLDWLILFDPGLTDDDVYRLLDRAILITSAHVCTCACTCGIRCSWVVWCVEFCTVDTLAKISSQLRRPIGPSLKGSLLQIWGLSSLSFQKQIIIGTAWIGAYMVNVRKLLAFL